MIAVPRVAYASTCTSSGGAQPNPGYYEAYACNQYLRYGVKAGINDYGWTYNSGQNGHSLLYVDIQYGNTHWSQAGIGVGLVDGQYQSQKLISFEWTNAAGSPQITWVTGYPIPDNDYGSAWTFAYQANGDGTYTYELGVTDPSRFTTWTTHPNVGAFYDGDVYGTTENAYFNGYNGACNVVMQYNTHSSLSYSSAITTNPNWYLWAGACNGASWSPYNVDITNCPNTVNEWGG